MMTSGGTFSYAFMIIEHTSNGILVSRSPFQQFGAYLNSPLYNLSDIAMHLVEIFSHMLKANQLPTDPVFDALTLLYPSLVECHCRHYFNPSPAPLLKEIQEWFSRMPESDLPSKVDNAESILLYLVRGNNLFKESLGSRITALEKQYLTSFAQLLVDFFERDDIKKHVQYSGIVNRSLADLRSYLDHNPPISS